MSEDTTGYGDLHKQESEKKDPHNENELRFQLKRYSGMYSTMIMGQVVRSDIDELEEAIGMIRFRTEEEFQKFRKLIEAV